MNRKPDITIRLKPAEMSRDDVRRLLWQAHRPNRERGMDFGSGRLAPEENPGERERLEKYPIGIISL